MFGFWKKLQSLRFLTEPLPKLWQSGCSNADSGILNIAGSPNSGRQLIKSKKDIMTFTDKTVVLCGGSKGIGKETAKLIASRGGSLCLIARNQAELKTAKTEVESLQENENQFVEIISCDTTDKDKLEPLLHKFIDTRGIPDVLINNVGYAYPQYIDELTLDDYKSCMEINYFGQLIPTLILLPHFRKAGRGHIANVSSMMGYFGIIGYASYAPTKFAIVGMTEAMRHELKPFGITFSILYPPDTDTPGFETENQSKPPECAKLSEDSKLMTPEAVARIFVNGIEKKKYSILPGEAGLIWRLHRFFPGLVRMVTDIQYKRALKSLRK